MRACLLVVSLWLVLVPRAHADHRLQWDPQWPYFQPAELVLTGVAVLGAIATTLWPYPDEPRWQGGILFDDAVRDALRARDPAVRDAVRYASDLTLLASVLQVAVVDSALIPIVDREAGVAGQLTLINAQAFAFNAVVSNTIFHLTARSRPLIPDCRRDPDFDPLCHTGMYASFPSSHTSTSFTAAGLMCAHHGHLPLYGGAWDVLACIESLTLAAATGLLRVIGDRHNLSDALVGAAIGFTIGYVYPWLLHYRFKADTPGARMGAEPPPVYQLHFGGQF